MLRLLRTLPKGPGDTPTTPTPEAPVLRELMIDPTEPLNTFTVRSRRDQRRREGQGLYVMLLGGPDGADGAAAGVQADRVYEVTTHSVDGAQVNLRAIGGSYDVQLTCRPEVLREAGQEEYEAAHRRYVLGQPLQLAPGAIVKISGPGWNQPYDRLQVIVGMPTAARPDRLRVSRLGAGGGEKPVTALLANIVCVIDVTGLAEQLHWDFIAG